MSDECQSGSERCTQVKRTIVALGVIAIALLLAALFVLLLPVAQGWRTTTADRQKRVEIAAVHASAGDVAYASGRYEDAAMDYMLASNFNPSDITLATRLSRAKTAGIAANPTLVDSMNLVETRNEVAAVAAAFPEDVTNVQVVRALMKFREGMVADAVTILEEAGKVDSASPAVHFANAVVWQFVPERVAGIGAEYDAVLAARPDDARIQGIAGEYFLSIGETEKGVTLIRSASGKIRNLDWLKTLATFGMRTGAPEAALKDIQLAQIIAPRDADVLGIYGQLLINSGEYGRAVEVLQQANTIRETRESLLQLGMAYNGLKRFDRALAILAKVIQAGQDAMSLFEYGNALAGVGNFDEAVKVYNAVLGAPDGAGTQNEDKVLVSIKESIRQRLASFPQNPPARK